MNCRINGMSIRQHSIIILLLGSIASYTHTHASAIFYSDPQHQDALTKSMIAEFALSYNDIPKAIENYTTLAIENNSPIIKQRALDIALENDDLSAALLITRHWVIQEPEDVPALFYLAHISLKTHEYNLAASTLDKILNIDPDADLEQILSGIVPESKQDRDNLLTALNQSKGKQNASLLALIANLEAQDGQYNQALKTINRALRKRPSVTGFILMKANLLQALDNSEATQKWYTTSTKRYPDNQDLRLAEVQFLIKKNQNKLALTKLKSMIEIWPNFDEALFIAGLTSIDLKQYEQAEDYLLQLRHSARYQNDAYYYLAVNAERKQHFDTAKAYYRLVDGSLYVVSRRRLVSIFEREGHLADALRFLTQERVNYPQHASFLYQLQADILKKTGHKEAAVRLLDEAIKNIPDDPELVYAEVVLLDPNIDRDKLDQSLKQLLLIEPNSPTYLNAYAYTLALQNRRLDEARSYAQLALEFAPNQASILDTLGFIEFLQNDFSAASQSLGQAYTISQNVNIGIRYAKALYMLGNLKKFTQVLSDLKQKNANNPQVQQLDSLILPVNPS